MTRSLRHAALLAVAAVCLPLLTGCAAYVNIPDQKGSVARSNPNTENVRLVEAESLTWLVTQSAVPGPVSVKLPPGSTAETYDWVLGQIGDRAVPYDQAGGLNSVDYEVRGVRIRAQDGFVDIAQTASAGVARIVTVELHYDPFGGWAVTDVVPWGTITDPSQQVFKPAGTQPAEW
ncbi:MAG: hypothetical protein AAGB29_14990 [Planctomycetota bacterium]